MTVDNTAHDWQLCCKEQYVAATADLEQDHWHMKHVIIVNTAADGHCKLLHTFRGVPALVAANTRAP